MCIRNFNLSFENEAGLFFSGHFLPLLRKATHFKAAQLLVEIGSSLKRGRHDQVKHVQIPDTHGTFRLTQLKKLHIDFFILKAKF